MNENTADGIILTSPAPIDDGGRKFNYIYVIAVVVLSLAFISTSGFGAGLALGIICGGIAGWIIKLIILNIKLGQLRSMEFRVSKKIPYEQIIQGLIPVLTPMGMMIEKDTDGSPVVTYQKIIYDVVYNENKQTFTVWWRLSVLWAMFWRTTLPIFMYRRMVVAMGIIAYNVQQICNSYTGTMFYQDEVKTGGQTNFCIQCGARLNPGDKFCQKCGNKVI